MCKEKCCELGKDPKECTPKQIKKCHGEEKEHSCEDQQEPEKKVEE